MRLKTSYSAREVAALTGLTARQLQGWDASRVFQSAIASRPTTSGGFTERRYSPVDVLELLALADLRRRGFTPSTLKQVMDVLRQYFRRRLSETLDDAGDLRLLTDGRGLFLRTRGGRRQHQGDQRNTNTDALRNGPSGPADKGARHIVGNAHANPS